MWVFRLSEEVAAAAAAAAVAAAPQSDGRKGGRTPE